MESQLARIPILQIEDFLVVSVPTALHDRAAIQFKDDLLQRVHGTKAEGLILDLAALDVVDSFIAKLTGDIAEMAALMGTAVVVTGLQPAVAVALVELGVELRGVITALNLEKGMKTLRQRQLSAPPRGSASGAQPDGRVRAAGSAPGLEPWTSIAGSGSTELASGPARPSGRSEAEGEA